MSIRKRTYKSGKQKWEVNYRDADGKRHNKVCPTLAAAKHFEAQALKEKFEEKELGINHTKQLEWNKIKNDFLENSKSTWTNNTYQLHYYCLKSWSDFLNKKFPRGEIYLSDITVEVINEFKTNRSEMVKNSTINRELTCLKTMMNWAMDSEEYDFETTLPRKIKLLKESSGRLRYLTEEEMQKIIEKAIPLHLKVFYVLAFATGMRKGEILGLKWSNIDLVNGFISVEKTKGSETTKSGKTRGISIDSSVCDVLKWWKEQIGKEYKLYSTPHYIPPVDNINVFKVKDVRKAHNTACKKAGIEDFRIHDCRHTAATIFRREGTRLDTLKNILGHSTIKLTMRYAHIGSKEQEEAAKKLGIVLLPGNIEDTLKPNTKPYKKE